MHILVFTLLVCTHTISSIPQDQSVSVKQKIQEIKLDGRYVFGESSNKEASIAYENAIDDLLFSANIIRTERGMVLLNRASLNDSIPTLTYCRGEQINVFLYLPCSDVLAISDTTGNVTVTVPETHDVDPAFFKDSNIKNEILQNVLDREMIDNVWGYLDNQKKSGNVIGLGKARSVSEIPESAYLILYDNHFRAVVVLSPHNNGQRCNVRTNAPESFSSYTGHGVIWFTM